jgi:hypothetical protein
MRPAPLFPAITALGLIADIGPPRPTEIGVSHTGFRQGPGRCLMHR